MSASLIIEGLRASVGTKEILKGVDLVVNAGEVHALMGPNGSGKSTLSYVLAGHPGYVVTGGSATLGGIDLLALSVTERAQAGLFLALQYPTEVPGVALESVLAEAVIAAGGAADGVSAAIRRESDAVGLATGLVERDLNVDLSGGEKKRAETVQLGVLRPQIAILDELDSGLDVDALRQVSARIQQATDEWGLGVLAITHYTRLLNELRPDVVHIFGQGRVLESGGYELAERLEETGYAAFA